MTQVQWSDHSTFTNKLFHVRNEHYHGYQACTLFKVLCCHSDELSALIYTLIPKHINDVLIAIG